MHTNLCTYIMHKLRCKMENQADICDYVRTGYTVALRNIFISGSSFHFRVNLHFFAHFQNIS